MQGKKQGIDVWPAEFDTAQKNNSFLNLREMFFPYGLMSFRRGLIFPRSFIFSLTHQAGSKNPISARSIMLQRLSLLRTPLTSTQKKGIYFYPAYFQVHSF